MSSFTSHLLLLDFPAAPSFHFSFPTLSAPLKIFIYLTLVFLSANVPKTSPEGNKTKINNPHFLQNYLKIYFY